jgi:hypothetical protein
MNATRNLPQPNNKTIDNLLLPIVTAPMNASLHPLLVLFVIVVLLHAISQVGFFQAWKGGGREIGIDKIPEREQIKFVSRLCSVAELTPGRWVNNTYERPPYIPMRGEVQQKICQDIDPGGSWKTWEWTPSSECSFSRFDSDLFCQVATNRTIAIIGDSTSFDHYLSLTHLLGIPRALPRVRNKNANLQSPVCNGTSTLVGQRDFYLQYIAKVVSDTFPDVMALNRGAHYTPITLLLNDFQQRIVPGLLDWQSQCEKRNRQCLLIWRTTVPGHPNCSQYMQPATSLEEMESLIASHNLSIIYRWDQFSDQNKLVLELFQNTSLEYQVMDAYHVNILRPDAHKHGNAKDCLHTVSSHAFSSFHGTNTDSSFVNM